MNSQRFFKPFFVLIVAAGVGTMLLSRHRLTLQQLDWRFLLLLVTMATVASQCDTMESHWGEVEDCCEAIPPALVHGDLVIKNVYLRPAPNGLALLVFDWENAGWGVPATDLCQFTGRVVSPDVAVYCTAMRASGRPLDSGRVSQLARYGSLLRLIDGIHWSTEKMAFDSYLFMETPVSTLRVYQVLLATLLGTFQWV